jgi:toxin ParE1/3/4
MKRDFVLSDRAARSFREIGIYTRDRFGREQMRFYLDGLLMRCQAIAEGTAHHQSCRAVFADDLREDLRFARAGSHYVIFVETEAEVRIVDFLHQSADVGGRLG